MLVCCDTVSSCDISHAYSVPLQSRRSFLGISIPVGLGARVKVIHRLGIERGEERRKRVTKNYRLPLVAAAGGSGVE